MSEAYKKIAEGLKLVAEGYETLASVAVPASTDNGEQKKSVNKSPVKEQTAEKETEKEAPFDREKVLVEIRAIMSKKCKDGKTQQCQALLKDFGVPNLSNVPDDKLLEVKSRAEVL